MYLVSNQQRRDIIDFLSAFVELTADNGSNRVYNMKRRAGLLIKNLNRKEEIDNELLKTIKNELKNRSEERGLEEVV